MVPGHLQSEYWLFCNKYVNHLHHGCQNQHSMVKIWYWSKSNLIVIVKKWNRFQGKLDYFNWKCCSFLFRDMNTNDCNFLHSCTSCFCVKKFYSRMCEWSASSLYNIKLLNFRACFVVCLVRIHWVWWKHTLKPITRRTWVGNKIVDHSDVVGASPVGAAPTTSSLSTQHLAL